MTTGLGEQSLGTRRRIQWRSLAGGLGPVAALALLVAFCAWRSDSFLKPENVVNILLQNSVMGIVAVGMTLVIISGGIDLSVGSLLALGGCAGILVLNAMMAWRNTETAAVVAAMGTIVAVGLVAGLLNGLLVAKGRLMPFIATLATMAIYRSLALWMADSSAVTSHSKKLFAVLGTEGIQVPLVEVARRHHLVIAYPVVAFAVIAVLGQFLLRATRYGRYLYAIGCNERAAVYSAVNVNRVKVMTYALVGVTCGIAAAINASRMGSVTSSSTGLFCELDAIAAVAIGGTRMQGGSGAIWRTVVGVLILAVLGNMVNMLNVPADLQGLVKGAVIIAACLLQRQPPSRELGFGRNP